MSCRCSSYTGSYQEVAYQVAAYEKAGLDIVWVADAYGYDAVNMTGYLRPRPRR